MDMIYFDHAATTRVLPEAAQAAVEAMTVAYGNPSSLYALGTQAAKAVAEHRATVAQALGCRPEELYFTSCGTEGDNWAVQLAVHLGRHKGKHIITTAVEHSAVLEPCKALEMQGYEVTYLHPDATGHIRIEALEEALRPDTVLVSMLLVNNETGAIQPVAEAAQVLKRHKSNALLHTDAVQGFLKLPFTPKGLGADLVTISGHKIGAMKGSGALFIRSGLRAIPLLRGGGQEKGLRSGTEATPQIAALAAAAKLGKDALDEHIAYLNDLKAYALAQFQALVPGLVVVSAGDAPPHLRHLPAGVPQPGGGAVSQRPGLLPLRRVGLSPGQGQPCVRRNEPLQARAGRDAAGVLRPQQHEGRGGPTGAGIAGRHQDLGRRRALTEGFCMKGKLLLFGFEDLFSAPAIIAAVEPLGLEVVRVPREDYGWKLEELAGLTPRKAKGTPYAGGPLGDKMIVLCGLGNQLDELLPVLRQAGAGPGCLKAVLTAHNKKWTAPALLTQLRKEQAMMQKKI